MDKTIREGEKEAVKLSASHDSVVRRGLGGRDESTPERGKEVGHSAKKISPSTQGESDHRSLFDSYIMLYIFIYYNTCIRETQFGGMS